MEAEKGLGNGLPNGGDGLPNGALSEPQAPKKQVRRVGAKPPVDRNVFSCVKNV